MTAKPTAARLLVGLQEAVLSDHRAFAAGTGQSPPDAHAVDRRRVAAIGALDPTLSRTISLLPEVSDVAEHCNGIDVAALEAALHRGAGRAEVIDQRRQEQDAATGSPHFFLPDGTDAHNPGVSFGWTGEPGLASCPSPWRMPR